MYIYFINLTFFIFFLFIISFYKYILYIYIYIYNVYILILLGLKEKIRANFENYNDTTIEMVDAAECYMKKLGKLLNDLQQSDEFSKYASENELNNKFMVPLSIEDCPVCI